MPQFNWALVYKGQVLAVHPHRITAIIEAYDRKLVNTVRRYRKDFLVDEACLVPILK